MEYKIAELNLDFYHRSLINLIKNAIDDGATSIAVRINVQLHRMMIIDNGIGFSFDMLRNIGEYKAKKFFFDVNNSTNDRHCYLCHKNYRNIVKNIAELLIIATRHENSVECYEKILKKGYLSQIQTIQTRPTHGTTLTIYFPDNLLQNSFHLAVFTSAINHLAKNYPQISFSIRDDDRQEITLQIKKRFRNPSNKRNYSLKSTNSFTLPLISDWEKKLLRNSTNCDNKSFFRYIFNPAVKAITSPIASESKSQPRNIHKHLENPTKVLGINSEYDIVPSQWSDWNLDPPNISYPNSRQSTANDIINANETRRYRFLPAKLTTLLPLNTNEKLVNRRMTQEFNTCGVFNYFDCLPRRQDLAVRPCNEMKKLHHYEITLERDCLKYMEVLNQVNFEFIAATVTQNGRKLLILIDQHAMHERIRYEYLLKDYKNDNNQLISVKLNRLMKIEDITPNICELIFDNYELFVKFGLELQRDPTTNTQILVKTIPKCFLRRKVSNFIDSMAITRNLLFEIVDKLINGIGFSNLPLTIHNSIASEACHGAIKFGDPLNFDQCNTMVDYWKQTNLPNRCAHGRPVIIPLLSIDN